LPRKDWDHFTAGSQVHLLLEKMYKLKGRLQDNIEINHLTDHLIKRASFTEYGKKLTLSQQDEINYIIVQYKQLYVDTFRNKFIVEQPFNFKLGEIEIEGFIDRVDFPPKFEGFDIEILDYKMAKQPKYLDKSLQLPLYAIATKEKYGYDKVVKTSYILLRHGCKKVSHIYTNEYLDHVKEEIKDIATQISKDIMWVESASPLCSYCDFEAVCSERAAWQDVTFN